MRPAIPSSGTSSLTIRWCAARGVELLVTFLFWGLWAYLVSPLLSLVLWYAGIYLFVDRMIRLGGYQILAEQLVRYSVALVAMWALLTAWVLWNQWRYGRNDRRTLAPAQVSPAQLAEAMGLGAETVAALQRSRRAFIGYDERQRPLLERLEAE